MRLPEECEKETQGKRKRQTRLTGGEVAFEKETQSKSKKKRPRVRNVDR